MRQPYLGTPSPDNAKDVPIRVLVGQVGRRGRHDLAWQIVCVDLHIARADAPQ